MFWYKFHIGDYAAHTQHLDPLEDIAYRRMLDYIYLNETQLPETVEEIARVIRMRTHSDCIAVVLQEFFYRTADGTYSNKRVDEELEAMKAKSAKAAESARKRWENDDANALPTQSERNARSHNGRNAIQEPRTKNQEPIKTAAAATGGRETLLDSEWSPDPESIKLLVMQGIPQNFIDFAAGEFKLYWKDRNEPRANWTSRFIKSCTTAWARDGIRWQQQLESNQQPTKGNRRTRDIPLEESLNDRSWAYQEGEN